MSADNINDLLKNPEQIKQMISMLSSLLETINQNTTTESIKEQVENTSPIKNNKKSSKVRKNPKEPSVNKFLSMPEANMFKEDPVTAQKLYKQSPIARTRKNDTVKAKCRVCGRQEEVRASLLYGGLERFKCNKCSTTPG